MSFLNREQLLNRRPLKREAVFVEDLGGDVLIWELTARDRDRYETENLPEERGARPNLANLRARFVAWCLREDDGSREGKRLLTTKEDVEALGEQGAGSVEKMFDAAQRLNGIGVEPKKSSANGKSSGCGLPESAGEPTLTTSSKN